MDKTFVMIKPDAVSRGLTGEIIRRFETGGLKVRALKMLRLSKAKAEELYSIHRARPFFDELVEFVTSGPVVVMVLQAPGVVERVRKLMGATDPGQAEQGTIRGDFAESITRNMVHGADSEESAEREIPIFFTELEIVA